MKLTLPLLYIVVVTPLTLLLTYYLATKHGHAHSHYPFLSDTIIYSPERAIAGIAFNLLAFVLGFTIYCRYLQVSEYAKVFAIDSMRLYNRAALIIGVNAAIGLFILVNCQADDVLMFYHLVGSSGFYFGIMAYLIFESIISLLTPEHVVSRLLAFTRAGIAISNVIFMIIMLQQGACAVPKFDGTANISWIFNPCRVLAAVMEKLILALIIVFLGTYYNEAATVTITLASIELDIDRTVKVTRHFV